MRHARQLQSSRLVVDDSRQLSLGDGVEDLLPQALSLSTQVEGVELDQLDAQCKDCFLRHMHVCSVRGLLASTRCTFSKRKC
jgi:hypothetical protein